VKYVMDASIAASLFLPDEEAGTAKAILGSGEVIVPTLFWYEMANILWAGVKRGRLDEAQAFRALELLRRLGIADDDRPIREVFPAVFLLARAHGITAYDAAYLELASREGATLCSHDVALRAAAPAVGLALLPV
jgi:predicted nucleic acid-binding protein